MELERDSAGRVFRDAISCASADYRPALKILTVTVGALECIFDVTATGEQFLPFVRAMNSVTINVNAHQFPSVLSQ